MRRTIASIRANPFGGTGELPGVWQGPPYPLIDCPAQFDGRATAMLDKAHDCQHTRPTLLEELVSCPELGNAAKFTD